MFKMEDRYVVQLNDEGLPRVRINPYYRKLLSRKEAIDKVTKEYIEERLRSAQWLIKGMEQRNKTIYKVAESIVKFQGEFLDQGISQLRPMVLKDVAEDIGMHESTISRVTTNKYMHTPQGIFPMKYFFTTGFSDGSGADVSSLTVKDTIQKMIKEEDPVGAAQGPADRRCPESAGNRHREKDRGEISRGTPDPADKRAKEDGKLNKHQLKHSTSTE